MVWTWDRNGEAHFAWDAGGVREIEVAGVKLMGPTGGLYLIGSTTGADVPAANYTSLNASGVMRDGAGNPGPAFSLACQRLDGRTLEVVVTVGPLSVPFASLSLPLDGHKGVWTAYLMPVASHLVGAGLTWTFRSGGGGTFASIPLIADIPGIGGTHDVGLARSPAALPWLELQAPGYHLRRILDTAAHKEVWFVNHPNTHGAEVSFAGDPSVNPSVPAGVVYTHRERIVVTPLSDNTGLPTGATAAQITQAYRDLLLRAPDADGLAHYLATGWPIDQIRADIMTSPEYAALNQVGRVTLTARLDPASVAATGGTSLVILTAPGMTLAAGPAESGPELRVPITVTPIPPPPPPPPGSDVSPVLRALPYVGWGWINHYYILPLASAVVTYDALGRALFEAGCNFSEIDALPTEPWVNLGNYQQPDAQITTAVYLDHLAAYVEAMRRWTITTKVNIVNWHNSSVRLWSVDRYRQHVQAILAAVGVDRCHAMPVAEPDDSQRARDFQAAGRDIWKAAGGTTFGNGPGGRGTPQVGGYDWIDWHWCLPLWTASTIKSNAYLNSTDCGNTLSALKGRADLVESQARIGVQGDRPMLYYGFDDDAPDYAAIEAIGRAIQAGGKGAGPFTGPMPEGRRNATARTPGG
jgi:hypothetical protein